MMGEDGKCTCGLGILKNGVCFCSDKGYFLDESLKCNKCNFTTRSKPGCVSDCPSGYFDVLGQNCESRVLIRMPFFLQGVHGTHKS